MICLLNLVFQSGLDLNVERQTCGFLRLSTQSTSNVWLQTAQVFAPLALCGITQHAPHPTHIVPPFERKGRVFKDRTFGIAVGHGVGIERRKGAVEANQGLFVVVHG